MVTAAKGVALIPGGSSGFRAVHTVHRVSRRFDLGRPQLGKLSEVASLRRASESLVDSSSKPPRILLLDSALALCGLHLRLLRSIPALVEKVVCRAEFYLHEEDAYALVILALHPHSRETAEVAHFVRHRWTAARILLLESESAAIDDWLYDERVDPRPHPAIVRDAAVRLMTEEGHWTTA